MYDKKYGTIRFLPTPFSAYRVNEISSRLGIDIFGDSMYEGLLDSANEILEYQNKKLLECVAIPNSPIKPWNHQNVGYWMLDNMPSVMLNWGMGCGKTRPVVQYIYNNDLKKVLILCPQSVVSSWKEQFDIYAKLEDYMLFLPFGTGNIRHSVASKQLAKGRAIVVLNYQIILNNNISKMIESTDWDMIVLDESHRIKSPSGKWSLLMFAASKNAKKKVCLTGTAISRNILDIYGQYRFLDAGIYGTNFGDFTNKYAIVSPYNSHVIQKFINLDDFHRKLSLLSYSVNTDDVLDLPDEIDIIKTFEPSDKLKKVYNGVKDDEYAVIDGNEVVIQNVLTKLVRLRQLSSGFIKCDNGIILDLDDSKQTVLQDMLEDLEFDEPVVIYTNFKYDMQSVKKVCSNVGRTYSELSGNVNQFDIWKSGKTNVLIAQIQSGSEGIDCTRSKYCIYYSVTNVPKDFFQSRRRILRPGQKNNVKYFYLFMNNSIDKKIYNHVIKNEDFIQEVIRGSMSL